MIPKLSCFLWKLPTRDFNCCGKSLFSCLGQDDILLDRLLRIHVAVSDLAVANPECMCSKVYQYRVKPNEREMSRLSQRKQTRCEIPIFLQRAWTFLMGTFYQLLQRIQRKRRMLLNIDSIRGPIARPSSHAWSRMPSAKTSTQVL